MTQVSVSAGHGKQILRKFLQFFFTQLKYAAHTFTVGKYICF